MSHKIYLDLPTKLKRVLRESRMTVSDVFRRQGVDIPLEISEAEIPSDVEGERGRDVGIVLATAALTLSIGATISMIILALSKFYKDREHAPQIVEVYAVKETTGPDGQIRKQLVLEKTFIQPHTAQSIAELEADLKLTEGVVVKFRTEEKPNPPTD